MDFESRVKLSFGKCKGRQKLVKSYLRYKCQQCKVHKKGPKYNEDILRSKENINEERMRP